MGSVRRSVMAMGDIFPVGTLGASRVSLLGLISVLWSKSTDTTPASRQAGVT